MEIQAGRNTPYIKLDIEKYSLTLKGKSYPEHPSEFYEPLWQKILNYSDFIEGSTITVNLALEIMNSITEKYIYKILEKIYSTSKKLIVNWYYEKGDDDMKEDGKTFNNIFPDSTFNIIRVNTIDTI